MDKELTRYELTIDGSRFIGLIHGGFGFKLFSEKDLEHMNKFLPMPPQFSRRRYEIISYFTTKGVNKFSYLVKLAEQKIQSNENVLGVKLITKKCFLSEVKDKIQYKDKWQVVIIKEIAS